MSASDFAVLHNGEVTVEAAACQLPALIVNSMSNINAYISYLYNGHESPLNVSTNFHGYEELLGSLTAIGDKVGTSMLNHFQKPKARFYYAGLYRQ
jgi:lipid A disaccharide synthetase